MDLKGKTALIYDHGIFFELALKLSESFGQIYYYCPYESAYPGMPMAVVGSEWENGEQLDTFEGKNVTRIINVFDYIDDIDIAIFPDVYDGDLQVYLAEQGIPVFGCKHGEDLELERWDTKQAFKKEGMDVQPIKEIVGMEALKEYLQNPKNENKWIKISRYRKHFETFKHKTWLLTEPAMEKLENDLGALKNIVHFVVEDNIDAVVEEGCDTYNLNGEWPDKIICGTEIKDAGYAGAFFDAKEISDGNKKVNEQLSPILKQIGYSGFLSTEVRTTKEGKNYLIDPCCRGGFPTLNVCMEMYDNLAEIIWGVANGKMVQPVVKHNYGIELIITTGWFLQNHQAIYFPKEIRNNVKLKNPILIDGNYYTLNFHGNSETGSIVAVGESFADCKKQLEEIVPKVEGFGIDVKMDTIDSALEEFDKMTKGGTPGT